MPSAALAPEIDIDRDFGPCDLQWIGSVMADGLSALRGRWPFRDTPAPTADLRENARVVLVSDWATGVPAAQAVGAEMGRWLSEAEGRQRHVIHLGDTYYSGWKEEYLKRFLPFWPHALGDERIQSWALNGNHDMYSGGEGYFGLLLRDTRFAGQAGSSYFTIEGPRWQIIGLDTAYEDFDLAGGQAEWMLRKVATSGKKTIVLSHHQFFSAYSKSGERLRERLATKLTEDRVAAWFWGHEHRCVIYEESEAIHAPRCIGHGGVPALVAEEDAPLPEGVKYESRGAVSSGGLRWGLFGFVVLDFCGPDGSEVEVSYVDETGETHYHEVLS